MIGGLWSKVSAGLAAIVALFFIVIRYQSKKIKEVEHENKIIHKKSEITQKQSAFKARVLADEQQSIIDGVKLNEAKKSKFDRLNDL